MESDLVDFLYKRLNKKIRQQAPQILSEIKSYFRAAIYESETYASLTSGGVSEQPLRGHFGFPVGQEQSIVNPIVEAFVDSLHYEFREFTKRSGGHFRIHGVPADYFNVLSLPTANIPNTVKTGGTIPWLFWLLKGGMGTQISDYRIAFSDLSLNASDAGITRYDSSRSKIALMYKHSGSDWMVPVEFAGDESDNWITRIIGSSQIKSPFYLKVEEILTRNLEL
jgi:hypothetical protein